MACSIVTGRQLHLGFVNLIGTGPLHFGFVNLTEIGPPTPYYLMKEGDNYGIEAVASSYYEKWLGAMLVLRTKPDSKPMTSSHEDILYIKELLHWYRYFLISKTIC